MRQILVAVLAPLLVGVGPLAPGLAGQEGQDAGVSSYELRSLDNGAELIVVPDASAERVTVNLLLRGGSSADPPRQAGVGSLTAQILTHSTRSRTREQLSSGLARLAAELGATVESDFTAIGLTTGPAELDEALDLMADVVLNPVLPADQLAGRVARARHVIELQAASPEFRASRAFIRAVYENHPYGVIETSETLNRIDVQDAVRYHRDYYRPNNAVFVVVGDVVPDAVAERLAAVFDDWERRPLSLPSYHGLPRESGRRVVLVHLPGAATAVVRAGGITPPGSHPAWPALRLANAVLGEDAGAWLGTELDSLAPGVGSTVTRRSDVGTFQVRFEATPEAVGPALRLTLGRLQDLAESGPGAGELDYRRSQLIAQAEGARQDPALLANLVTQSLLLGREQDDIQEYAARLEALTPDQVRAAAAEHMAPDGLTIVVAGDATRLHEALSSFGTVRVVDPEGNTVALDALDAPPPSLDLDATGLTPRTWTYRVQAQGMQVGEVTRTLVEDVVEGTYRLDSQATIGPRSVNRSVTFDSRSFKPLSSEDDVRVGGQRLHSSLTLADGRVSGTLSVPGGQQQVEGAAAPGALLGEMAEAALWIMDLDERRSFTLPVIGQDGASVEVQVEVLGTQTVQVPAGTFDAWEVEVVGAGQDQRIFVSVEHPRQTVKIELVDQPVETILHSVREAR